MGQLSNFVLKSVKGRNATDWEFFADVDHTTGALWWKHTRRREIHREYAGSWHFSDDGEFTEGWQAEKLERAWKATHGMFPNVM